MILVSFVVDRCLSIVAADDGLAACASGEGHPDWNGDAVTYEMNGAVAEEELHSIGVGAHGGIGVEDAGCVGSGGAGVAHQERHLGAEVTRRQQKGVLRACWPANPGRIREPAGALADKKSVAESIGNIDDAKALRGTNEMRPCGAAS